MAEDAKRKALAEALRRPQTLRGINAQHMRQPQPQKPPMRPSFVRG